MSVPIVDGCPVRTNSAPQATRLSLCCGRTSHDKRNKTGSVQFSTPAEVIRYVLARSRPI